MDEYICPACGMTQSGEGTCPHDHIALVRIEPIEAAPAAATRAAADETASQDTMAQGTTSAGRALPTLPDEAVPAESDAVPTAPAKPAAPASAPTLSPLPAIPPDRAPAPTGPLSAVQAAEQGSAMRIPVRPKLKPFLSVHTDQDPVLVARSWAGQTLAPEDRKLGRQRKIAEGLPDWNPMPPGELTVTRTARDATS
jgi:hypothetical protein